MNEKQSGANGTMVLNPVLKDHDGDYVCKADNDFGEPLEKKFTLVIHGNKSFMVDTIFLYLLDTFVRFPC